MADLERRAAEAERQRAANKEEAAQLASRAEALATDVAAARDRCRAVDDQRLRVQAKQAAADAAAADASKRLEEATAVKKVA